MKTFLILFLFLSSTLIQAQEVWFSLPQTKDLNITCLAKDSTNILYAGTDNGLYVSSDLGFNWKKVYSNDGWRPIQNVVVTSQNKVYFSTIGKGIFSYNQKESKIDTCSYNMTDKIGYVKLIKLANDDIYSVLDVFSKSEIGPHFYKLVDSSWQLIKVDNINNSIATDAQKIILNFVNNLIHYYPTTNTFEYHYLEAIILECSKAYNTVLYAIESGKKLNIQSGSSNTGNFFVKSTDLGLTWRRILNGYDTLDANCLIDLDTLNLLLGTREGVFYSNNAGEKWINISDSNISNLNITSLLVINDTIYCGTSNSGIYKSALQKHDSFILYQWFYKNGYKEFQASGTDITLLELDSSKNELIVNSDYTVAFFDFDSLNKKRIIHSRGKDTTWHMNKYVYLSADKKHLIKFKGDYGNYITTYLLNPDLLCDNNIRLNVQNYCQSVYTDYVDLCTNNKNQLIIGLSGKCNWKFTDFTGHFSKLYLNNDSNDTQIPISYFTRVKVSKNGDYIFTGENSIALFDTYTGKYISSLSYGNADEVTTNDDNTLCAVHDNNNQINIYSIPDWKLISSFTYEKAGQITSMGFNSLNRLVTISSDGEIKYWKMFYPTPIDAIVIENKNVSQKIKLVSSDEILTYGSDGFIRYIKNPLLSSRNIIGDNDNLFEVFPNPATDFIEISVVANGPSPLQSDVKIYDVLGKCVNLTPALFIHGEGVRIDVSALSPGMYFVRIGDKVGKFVKY